jgi:hypothetical protein
MLHQPVPTGLRAVGAGSCVVAAVSLIVTEPRRGPVLLIVSSSHGVHLGDLPAAALLVLAIQLVGGRAVVRQPGVRARRRRAGGPWVPIVASLTAGIVLLLVGGSELAEPALQHHPLVDATISAAVVAVATWVAVAAGPSATVPSLILLAGMIIDGQLTPTGTVIGPALLAGFLGVGAPSGLARTALTLTATVFAGASLASLRDVWGIDVRMAAADGGPARTAAVGVVLLVAGVAAWWSARVGPTSERR